MGGIISHGIVQTGDVGEVGTIEVVKLMKSLNVEKTAGRCLGGGS